MGPSELCVWSIWQGQTSLRQEFGPLVVSEAKGEDVWTLGTLLQYHRRMLFPWITNWQIVGEMILEASPYHVAKLAILAEPNCDYPALDQVVGISLASPARGGMQGCNEH